MADAHARVCLHVNVMWCFAGAQSGWFRAGAEKFVLKVAYCSCLVPLVMMLFRMASHEIHCLPSLCLLKDFLLRSGIVPGRHILLFRHVQAWLWREHAASMMHPINSSSGRCTVREVVLLDLVAIAVKKRLVSSLQHATIIMMMIIIIMIIYSTQITREALDQEKSSVYCS